MTSRGKQLADAVADGRSLALLTGSGLLAAAILLALLMPAESGRAPTVGQRLGTAPDAFRAQVIAAAAASALAVGVEQWAAHGGDLAGHVDAALDALGRLDDA